MNTSVASSAKRLLVRQCLAGLLIASLRFARPLEAATFTVLTTNDTGGGSFRQALLDANAAPGLDVITFAITNVGKTISPASALPAITEPVTMDGATQPGYSNAPLVEINGTSAGAGVDGLRIWTSNTLIRALCINRFTSDGIEIATNGFNSVQGCWIGLGLDGTTARANTLSGIFITNSANNVIGNATNGPANYLSGNTQNGVHIGGATATNNLVVGNVIGLDRASADKGNAQNGVLLNLAPGNTIGGTTTAAQNILSGNNSDGVEINGSSASNNVVQGNFIGTDAGGLLDRGNSADGIYITGAAGNTIGGSAGGAGNRLVFNNSDGIEITGVVSSLNVIQGNAIGTDASGALQQGNAAAGVNLTSNARTNTIGGVIAGEGNRLQFNGGDGVYVNAGTNNTVRGNSIYQNGDLGIDLGTTGITLNDNGDPDAGANQLQNFPILSAATNTATEVVLAGTLNSRPSQAYSIDFYASWLPDAVTNGEGQFYLGSTNITTDAASNATFTVTLPVVASGRYFTATATDAYGNTSEFGPSVRSVSLVAPAAFTVVNTNDSGAGSLRQAIIDANSLAGNGTNTLSFNIAAAGIQRISLVSALPPLAAAVVLDGYTQPGATANTLTNGFNANILIRLDGTNSNGTGADGLQIAASNCVVRGLYITSFSGDGIEITAGSGSAVEGCVIGLDSANNDVGNTGNGVLVNAPTSRIGGTTAAGRNIVSGNQQAGVAITASGSGCLIQGNFIGAGFDGRLDRGNSTDGVLITGSTGNTIGGGAAGAGNLISGNTSDGVEINGLGATLNVVQGNFIGVGMSDSLTFANGGAGVNVASNARTNTIGGVGAGEGNRIAFNTGDGVFVNTGTNNAIRGNAIFSNGDLGIDLGSTGVAANDAGDPDAGANQLQNFPVLTAATNSAAGTEIRGTLNSRPSTIYTLDFYSNVGVETSGYGEGQDYLGSATATSDAASNATFAVTLPVTNLTGRYVTATATDPFGNTSEFCALIPVISLLPGQTFSVVNTSDFGPGSLRQAIMDANATINSGDMIAFALPGPGPHTLAPVVSLPQLSDEGTTINGYSQSGATANTLTTSDDAVIKIKLDGNSLPASTDLLRITSSNCVIRGLSLVRAKNDAIELLTYAANTVVDGCFIGLDTDGTNALANAAMGINVNGTANNVLGGPTPAARNLISGNSSSGIQLLGAGTISNVVQGNFIGTDRTGALDKGNGNYGVFVSGAPANRILGNLISGNGNDGVRLDGLASTWNVIQGNTIGTDLSGTIALANSYGIEVANNARTNTIGGTGVGEGNRIWFNVNDGIYVATGTNNAIRGNSIFANTDLGIDLGTTGTTTNDLNDADTGANQLQNFPVLTAATNSLASTVIAGSLNSAASQTYGIDFFSSPTNDVSGFGEGATYLGSTNVTTDGSGNASFVATLPVPVVGRYVTATATDPFGNTSEFSAGVRSVSLIAPTTFTVINTNDSGAGSLRQAILNANATISATPNTIAFNIPGVGVQTNRPASALPLIFEPVIMDGYTQPGSAANSSASAFTGTVLIQLNGASAGAGVDGLRFLCGGNTIRGLTIINFNGDGIEFVTGNVSAVEGCLIGVDGAGTDLGNGGYGVHITGSSGNTIGGATPAARNVVSGQNNSGLRFASAAASGNQVLGNLIGTDLSGTAARGNGTGIEISTSHSNVIGGTNAAARNVISGNTTGVNLLSGSTNNIVLGNYVGTDATGMADLGNAGDGVSVNASANNVIGGTSAGAGNLISGNNSDGVVLTAAGATGNQVLGNRIGLNAMGTGTLGNGANGILISSCSSNVIGGTSAGAANRIAASGADGVSVSGTSVTNNALRANAIWASGDLAIDLGTSGITTNDPGDPDTGANQLQNFPLLTAVTNSTTNILIYGTLNSVASRTYELDFFANPAPDTLGNGEAQVYLGSTNVATDGSGNGSFVANLPVLITNRHITATATDPFGNTSELSTAVPSVSLIPPVTLTVVNTNDSGVGSLRQALLDANSFISASNNTIAFNIPGGGPHVIAPLSALPTPLEPLTIDGYTQPGASVNTLSNSFNAVIKIVLDGVSAGAGVEGLKLSQAGNVVRGLNIIRFLGEGIEVNTGGRNTIAGNIIGLGLDGSDQGNGVNGVLLSGCASNVVGGLTPAARNVLSGNQSDGVEISGGASAGNLVAGNFIGLGLDGISDRGNSADGVLISAAPGNLVGGTNFAARNVISGNNNQGIEISTAGASNNIVQGNYIGTDVAGSADVGNTSYGVYVTSVPGSLIGGSVAGAGNVVSGNNSDGIYVTGAGATGTVIAGNRVGTDAAGAMALGNSSYGIEINDGIGTRIGGTAGAERNLVSGNFSTGIYLHGNSATNIAVLGNHIGTDVTGTLPLPNSQSGILISATPRGTLIGGTGASEANVIAFNLADGVSVASGTNNAIRGNSIFDNGDLGIDLGTSGVTTNDVGDADTGANQLQNYPLLTAATNTPAGTIVAGTLSSAASTTYALDFFANTLPDASGNGEGRQYLGSGSIGTDSSGNATFLFSLPTVMSGRWVTATATDPLGNTSEFGPALAAQSTLAVTNLVVINTNDSGAGSLRQAILTANAWVSGGNDTITFNIPGAGVQTITPLSPLPVLSDPVTLDGYTQPTASANTLTNGDNATLRIRLEGSAAGADGLVIAAANSVIRGLCVFNFPGNDLVEIRRGSGSLVEGCFLGVDTDGVTIKTNTGAAVRIAGALTSGNTIGGTTPAARNVISGEGYGVYVADSGSNVIQGNFVGTDASGTQARGNYYVGIELDPASNTLVGGTAPGARNVVSGNGQQNAYRASGLYIAGGSGVRVEGNYIGTDIWGTNKVPNGYYGILIQDGATACVVGGTNPAARNLISGNASHGITIPYSTPSCVSNRIEGNWIGLSATGTNALGNSGHGIYLYQGARTNFIGGPASGARNVISGNSSGGIALEYADSTVVQGNYIGTDASGTRPVGNAGEGISIRGYSSPPHANRIGGTNANEGNVIAYNAYGVTVLIATGNAILGNSICSNNSLGIDLSANYFYGVSPNDVGDADTGGNTMQNFPVLYHGASAPGVTTLRGILNSSTNGSFRIEFFANDAQDSSGYGEGQQFLGATNVTTDGNGNTSFVWDAPLSLATNRFVTATATDTNGNTSEFSAVAPVVPFDSVDLKVAVLEPGDPLRTGVPFTYTITVTNFGPTNATSVVVTDTLPANVAYVSATTSQGTVGHSSSVVTANLGTLNLLGTATITITVQPNAAGAALNTVAVSTPVFDYNSANNTASISTFLGIADVSVTLADSPDSIVAGQLLTLSYAVSNAGPDVATAVTLTAHVYGDSQVVSTTPSQGTVTGGPTPYTAAFGTVPVGGTATLTITTIPLETGTAYHSTSVALAESDPANGNNTAEQETEVLAGPGVFQFYGTEQGVYENSGFAYISVRRTGGALVAGTVQLSTTDLSAVSGLDYVGTNVTLSFDTNQTDSFVAIPILDDTQFECNETFQVRLSNPTGGTVAAGLTNLLVTIYETDLSVAGQISGVSTANTNLPAGGVGNSDRARISADGRKVVFASTAGNLLPLDYSSSDDLFLRDLPAHTTTLVTADPYGYAVGGGYSSSFELNPDGRWVAFDSYSDSLVLDDTNGFSDVFLRDMFVGVTTLISVNQSGTSGGNDYSFLPNFGPAMSTNGQRVVFLSPATDLVSESDANFSDDIFVRDVAAGTTTLVSVNAAGTAAGNSSSYDPTISADGNAAAFSSYAGDLVAGDANFDQDVFVRYLGSNVTVMVSVQTNGTVAGNGSSSRPLVSATARYVAFQSYASNLTTNQDAGYDADVFRRDLQSGVTLLASINTNGAAANGYSELAGFSPDGRYVLFTSDAGDLVAGDTNNTQDVFVRDLTTGTTYLVSVTPGGTAGNGGSYAPAMSDDGRYVTFESLATNLVAGLKTDGNHADVFVWDRVAGTTTLASHSAFNGLAGNAAATQPDISAGGGVVSFSSYATDLVAGDSSYYDDVFTWHRTADTNELVSVGSSATPLGASYSIMVSGNGTRAVFISEAANVVTNDRNNTSDVFLRDLATGQTTLVSKNVAGTAAGAGYSDWALISNDGRYVAFQSDATDITTLDGNLNYDVFLYDANTGTNRLLSLNTAGTGGGNSDSYLWDVSPDGRFVAFTSYATNLVAVTDTNSSQDVFLRDSVANTTTLLSVTPAGTGTGAGEADAPAVNDDGRYVAFSSAAANLLAGSTSNLFAAMQILVRDRTAGTTYLASATSGYLPADGACYSPSISSDGRYVAFQSAAANLATGDTNGTDDIFVRDLLTGTTLLASATDGTTNAGNGSAYGAQLSGNGRYVVFVSSASNLVPGDLNGASDVFVRDLLTGDTLLVSANCAGTAAGNRQSASASISPDGRHVVFESLASDLVPGYISGYVNNIYRRDVLTGTTILVSRGLNQYSGGNSSSVLPGLSDSGGVVVFSSYASDLIANDANQREDVFAWQAVTTGGVDLALSKTVSTSQIGLGGSFSYTVVVSNLSTNTATGVQVSDPVPVGLLVNGASASQGTLTTNGNLITLSVGTLAPSASATLTIQATAIVPDWKFNTATASGPQFDTVPGNNTASAWIYVIPTAPPPALGIALDGGLPTLQWPSSATGYSLQTTTNLVPTVNWTGLTNTVSDDGTWKRVVLTPDPDEAARFYRLFKP